MKKAYFYRLFLRQITLKNQLAVAMYPSLDSTTEHRSNFPTLQLNTRCNVGGSKLVGLRTI